MQNGPSLLLTFLMFFPVSTLAQQSIQLEQLAWIAGCWEGGGNERVSHEQWMKPAGGMMMGMSRTVVKGSVREYEFVRITQDSSGIYYRANPSGQQEAAFKLIKYSNREAVFENPQHDFPQRIMYRLKDDSSLHARIEGMRKGKERGVDFPMKRVKCE